ncbi:transmembrane protein 143-like [Physella acuta]|uniref:transmembrane protein 143-like n=1 Tax=Physella acuta TaxID=109671 RepID=UPI0027DB4129|nr:transmembrane protein 143-like [Physella acuta]
MAASLVCRNLGTKCHSILRLTLSEPRKLRVFAFNPERLQPVSSSQTSGQLYKKSFSTSSNTFDPLTTKTRSLSTGNESENTDPPQSQDTYKELYIPITMQTIIRHLIQDKGLLTDIEHKILPEFVSALDSVLVNKYYGVLQELKELFDPINPDKDTISIREMTRGEKLDKEFWLIQKLEDVMKKANFHELPRDRVEQLLKPHPSEQGVHVTVDPSRYDVLKFWVLGQEKPELELSALDRTVDKIFKLKPKQPVEYYKRVVVAVRLKKDLKLMLKAFKEIPIESIETLLPDGKIEMSPFDKAALAFFSSLAGLGVLTKTVTVLAGLNIDWTLSFTFIGSYGLKIWSSHNEKKNEYLRQLSRTLYSKNIANNKGLLTLMVDRAADETLKEALLTYVFLLTSQPMSEREDQSSWSNSDGFTKQELEDLVSAWIKQKTGVDLHFDSSESLQIFKTLGLVSEKNDKLQVLSLDAACRILPKVPLSVITRRAAEADITEGYDRDEYLETEAEYKAEDKKSRRNGWF